MNRSQARHRPIERLSALPLLVAPSSEARCRFASIPLPIAGTHCAFIEWFAQRLRETLLGRGRLSRVKMPSVNRLKEALRLFPAATVRVDEFGGRKRPRLLALTLGR